MPPLARLLLTALVLLAPAYHCFLLPKRGSGGGVSAGTGTGGGSNGHGGWGLGRLLAEALEGVGGKEGATGSGGGVHAHPNMRRADELLRKRGAANYREAYKLLKELVAEEPEDHTVKLKMAEASVSFLRTATNANAVMVDGISDSEANRQLWKEFAFEAYDLLQEVHKARPDDPHVHVLMAEAYTYRTSSKGIVKAAVTGDGLTFMKYVKQIVQRYPKFDEGVPHIYDGAFKLAAPWPLRDVGGAVKAFERAHAVQPRSLRNNYFLGVAHFHNSDFGAAERHFRFALTEAESLAPTEFDVAEFFRRESRRALGLLEEKGAAGGKGKGKGGGEL